jgi:predicted Zn-dependent protease with MMP-like domain
MSRDDFEKLVREGFETIPERFRKQVQNVALLVEDEPSEDIRRIEGLTEHETLLGHYYGLPLDERGSHYGVGPTMPDTIIIYQQPIEAEAAELVRHRVSNSFEEAVRQVVADTVWHEIAHHFGFDEREVEEHERKRENGTD